MWSFRDDYPLPWEKDFNMTRYGDEFPAPERPVETLKADEFPDHEGLWWFEHYGQPVNVYYDAMLERLAMNGGEALPKGRWQKAENPFRGTN